MKPTLWTCSHNDNDEGHLVVARSREEASRLYLAAVLTEAEYRETFIDVHTVATHPAEWRYETEAPLPSDKILGIWVPRDAVLAGYGFMVSDDYRECPCCGLVLHEDDWSEDDPDEDVCTSCQSTGEQGGV